MSTENINITPQTSQTSKPRRRKTKGICPRCNKLYTNLVKKKRGERVYLYSVHYLGKGKKKYCYLGPLDGYEYVINLHNLQPLTNLMFQARVDDLKIAYRLIKKHENWFIENYSRDREKVYTYHNIVYNLRKIIEKLDPTFREE